MCKPRCSIALRHRFLNGSQQLAREREDEKRRIRAAKKRRRSLTVSIDGQDAI
jgi:hypothetical protein